MLTSKQSQLLNYVNTCIKDNGVAPSFDEMRDALDLKSKSGIHRLITALEERGFIRRLANKARALEVVKLPEDSAVQLKTASSANIIQGNFNPRQSPHDVTKSGSEGFSIPLYGKIAAGTPIEAFRDNSNIISVPGDYLGTGEYYALEVEGSSMIDAGILDGDTVVIKRGSIAENGAVVVALIDNEEVTLKRFRRRGNSVALEAANKAYETRIFGPDRIQIQGSVVSLLRRYKN